MALFLVTGGAGFIGSHLVDLLLAGGHAVRVLDDLSTGRRGNLDGRAELVVGDVADCALLRDAADGAAGIFHLAAIASVPRSNADWCGASRVNLGGTVAALAAARAQGRIAVVYASSAAVYGEGTGEALREDAPARPLSPYGADKLAGELHAAAGRTVHGVSSLGFRFFNVYGPRQDPASPYSGVISRFAAAAHAGEGVVVHGDGGQVRDFVHVSDVVRGLAVGMAVARAAPRAGVLNLCTGRATSVLDLARAVGAAAGRALPLRHGPRRAGDIRASVGDPSRAAALLGWRARVGLEDGLRGLLAQPGPALPAA